MSVREFESLTPNEFGAVCRSYGEARDSAARDSWERTRILAAIVIQPFVKGKITPERLLPLPWDKKKETPKVSKEEDKARLEKLMKRTNHLSSVESSSSS